MTHGTRRTFLKASGAIAATALLGSHELNAEPLSMPIGLQLYSVRELLPKDFDGTLHQLSAAGYKEVEAAGYFNKTAAEWKHAMDAAGLHCISTHHPLGQLKPNENQLIDYAQAVGARYMICSWPLHRDPAANGAMTLDDWHYVADEFNRLGAKINAAGMQFGFHNHTPEFQQENGVVFYDELLKRTDPKLVVFEMDCGWVIAAGRNPVDYLSKYPERFPLLHVKDMAKGPKGDFHSVVMGTGVADYRPIFKAATGLKHYFIEQEEFVGNQMDELRQDAQYLQKFSV